ncbi:MAG: D-alanyl-D-alanine carboxypeptidase/D-alanyl-D-alanine endopeptidase [Stackebrandtia sp.]
MRKRPLIYALPVPLIAAAIAVAAISSPAGADPGEEALKETIDEILADDRLDGAAASVLVADAASGDVLYERNPDTRLMPASNTKLLTSSAALELLGGDYTYRTDANADGKVKGSALVGDLYLRGTGDPTMLAEDYDALAADIAASGVTTITGDLVADDTRFDDVRLGQDWAWDDEPYYYAAQISPLTVAPDTDYDAGTVIVTAAPGDNPGDDPKVTVTPDTDYVDIVNRASTVESGADETLSIEREHESNDIVISGDLPVDAEPASDWASVSRPTGYAADVFAGALKDNGVKLVGDVRLGEATPDDAETLAAHDSMPLDELMIPFMKLSNNGHAEVLTKTIGYETSGEGTWSAGLAAVDEYLASAGVDLDAVRHVDGSGLSRQNHLPSEEFAALLVAGRDAPWFDVWYDSMPIACADDRLVGGTLRSRMCDTPAEGNVHAKTGTLTGATGLSGYVADADGRELVFSIVLNNYLADTVKDIEDEIAIALASFSEEEASAPMPQYTPQDSGGDGGLECSWTKPASC